MKLLPGAPDTPGSFADTAGAGFTVYSAAAETVELCLFDTQHREISRHAMLPSAGHNWHGYLPGCQEGQVYGYRVHGPWDPDRGLRCNPAKLLLDPYARELSGQFHWAEAVFDYQLGNEGSAGWQVNDLDSAPYVQKAVVTAGRIPEPRRYSGKSRAIPWAETVIYECNLRGYTMRFPGLDASLRGRFKGLANKEVLAWIRALGITSIELQPVQAFIDEFFLSQRGLRNYWGYNTLAFFAPEPRYAAGNALWELYEMVNSIHDAGLEVILDVAFNHTAESGALGPTLSFRGIDNLSWYRTEPGDQGVYINDTGCGNTLDADHPKAQDLVVDALRYWSKTFGIDGFRFDLATILGRNASGFDRSHPLLQRISADPQIKDLKLIAEPWDPGPGGYQLGQFPPGWAEWNDRFRDTARQYWQGQGGTLHELAGRLHGSADFFEPSGRSPSASINFVTSHDGFNLNDLVSYEHRHNEANGEDNRDGHSHNISCNYGVEGPSDDPLILAARRQHRLNLLATLLLSQGTPMLLAGDEFGHSQSGNNNAYAQDNETTWLDWSLRQRDPEFTDAVRALIALRRNWPLFRLESYVHERVASQSGSGQSGALSPTIGWFHPDGTAMQDGDWSHATALMLLLSGAGQSVALLLNNSMHPFEFFLPGLHWSVVFASPPAWPVLQASQLTLPAQSSASLVKADEGLS
jgi:glycogen operon protein